MRRYLLTAAMALALGAAGSAMADPAGDQGGDHHDHQNGQGGHNGGQGGGQGGHHTQFHTQGQVQGNGGQGGEHGRERRFTGQQGGGGGQYGGQNGGEEHRRGRGGGENPQTWNGGRNLGGADPFRFHEHSLRGRDQGRVWFSFNHFPHEEFAHHRFHVTRWVYPPGWYFREWAFGDFLPWGWYAPAYYLDWGYYGLPAPPIGCEWIREGHDALLIDVWTGEVLSVWRDVFW